MDGAEWRKEKEKKIMKKLVLGLIAAVCCITTTSAEVEVSGGVDFVSSYNWRGMQQSGPALQPGVEVAVGGFSVGAWGSSSFDANATTSKELDFYLGYSIGGFSITITDYWWDGETSNTYLYKDTHQQEVGLSYTFLDDKFTVAWSTIVAGAPDMDADGSQLYSSYASLSYSCSIAETVGCDITVGVNPWDSQWGTMGVSSVGVCFSYDLIASDKFTLPVFVDASVSPTNSNAYLVAGLSFGF